MKVLIESTQEEFDRLRGDLILKIAGEHFDLDIVKAMKEKAKPMLRIQDDILSYWDRKHKQMVKEIKSDIDRILAE